MIAKKRSFEADSCIKDVSDTALWVAVYRGMESERLDALFKDPFAKRLAGERGKQIAKEIPGGHYTYWTLSIRTVIIDNFINECVREGVDTILNLGAGLDARPYRLDLPADLKWIDVDFPNLIQYKRKQLQDDKPRCRLELISMDLGDQIARRNLLGSVLQNSRKALVLTEGVIPYLTNEEVKSLAEDLRSQKPMLYWIADYYSAQSMQLIMRMQKGMENAPIRFNPPDWFAFFDQHGWAARETRFMLDESIRLGRRIPMPWWMAVRRFLFSGPRPARSSAFVLLVPK